MLPYPRLSFAPIHSQQPLIGTGLIFTAVFGASPASPDAVTAWCSSALQAASPTRGPVCAGSLGVPRAPTDAGACGERPLDAMDCGREFGSYFVNQPALSLAERGLVHYGVRENRPVLVGKP